MVRIWARGEDGVPAGIERRSIVVLRGEGLWPSVPNTTKYCRAVLPGHEAYTAPLAIVFYDGLLLCVIVARFFGRPYVAMVVCGSSVNLKMSLRAGNEHRRHTG